MRRKSPTSACTVLVSPTATYLPADNLPGGKCSRENAFQIANGGIGSMKYKVGKGGRLRSQQRAGLTGLTGFHAVCSRSSWRAPAPNCGSVFVPHFLPSCWVEPFLDLQVIFPPQAGTGTQRGAGGLARAGRGSCGCPTRECPRPGWGSLVCARCPCAAPTPSLCSCGVTLKYMKKFITFMAFNKSLSGNFFQQL